MAAGMIASIANMVGYILCNSVHPQCVTVSVYGGEVRCVMAIFKIVMLMYLVLSIVCLLI